MGYKPSVAMSKEKLQDLNPRMCPSKTGSAKSSRNDFFLV
jgi:hypothetical protein